MRGIKLEKWGGKRFLTRAALLISPDLQPGPERR